jgi:hypothetical protein
MATNMLAQRALSKIKASQYKPQSTTKTDLQQLDLPLESIHI